MKKKIAIIIGLLVLMFLVFMAGWLLKEKFSKQSYVSSPLRLTDFKFARPLLVCDTNPNKANPELQSLEVKLKNLIDKEKKDKKVSTASVYMQDFKTDGRIDINKDEKFDSASMGKVSIALAFFRLAESDYSILSQRIKYNSGRDENFSQEIKPNDYAKIGETYTIQELIEKMLKYSDNNSTYMLLSFLEPGKLQELYQDLQVPGQMDPQKPGGYDYMTTRDVSYFFRVLYNSTYLMNDLSEKILEILTETDYKNGLVAGVPEGIVVAHKFGLTSLESNGNIVERELHDCGIIYHPDNPYLLCVMTKSSSTVPDIESAIKDISSMVYQYANKKQ